MFIIGLGNPGNEYALNRHNVGFMFVDWIASTILSDSVWHTNSKKHFAYVSSKMRNDRLILVKPLSFMNLSGKPTHASLDFFQRSPDEPLIVAHDDLDIALGAYKFDFAKGPKVHNGLDSIEASMRTDQFWRVRLGIDNRDPTNRVDGETYVLQNFTPEEKTKVVSQFSSIWERIQNQTY